jgi:tRNA-2-methylthio-N6-dimethylallyladenosine synthase
MSKKLFIQTLGCQMNSRDTEHIIAELKDKKDYDLIDNYQEADLILINTCSVREKPVQKLFSEIGVFNKHKKRDAKIGVCGCTASHLGEEIIKKAPSVDFVLGARNVSKISEIVDIKGAVEVDINYDESSYVFSSYRTNLYKSLINISIGCDKRCTFCIVPNTRGEEISIPSNLILDEVKKSVQNGIKEIFLLGQNVNNYGRRFSDSSEKKLNFTKLLQQVSDIDGVERIRFTSPHPLHMDDEFIKEFATNNKICKSIHVPLQSGSTKVLKDMKRGYTKEWFLDRVFMIKDLVPNVSISTDIIVGFPNESDKDFQDTIDIINQVKFEQIFNFKYSPRPNTQAINFDGAVDDKIASSRLDEVINLHKLQLDKIMENQLGKTYNILFEELRSEGFVGGRSDNNFSVKVKGSEELLGKTLNVKITDKNRMFLSGVLV